MPTGLHPSVDDDGSHELETALPHAFEIVSDRGVFAGIVLPSPTTTRSLITDLPSGRHHDKTGAWEMHTDLSDRGIAASDDDLMDARGNQLADHRVASGIIRRD